MISHYQLCSRNISVENFLGLFRETTASKHASKILTEAPKKKTFFRKVVYFLASSIIYDNFFIYLHMKFKEKIHVKYILSI